MERFKNIAQHPVFSKSIEEPVYDGRLFHEEYQEAEAHKAMLYRQMHPWDRFNRKLHPKDCLKGGLEHYANSVEEQIHILETRRPCTTC